MSESSEISLAPKEEKFTRLPKNPEIQAKINQTFTESGVAQKIVKSLMDPRPVNWMYPIKVEDCNFGVYKHLDWRGEKEQTSFVVEFPNPDPEQGEYLPRPEMYVGFGIKGKDFDHHLVLDETQVQVVEDAFKLQQSKTLK